MYYNGYYTLWQDAGDKELFSYGGRPKLRAQLGKVDFDQAMTIALLAVSSELSVNEYNSANAEQLEALAKSFHVDTAAIRKQVAAEVAAKKCRWPRSSSVAHRALLRIRHPEVETSQVRWSGRLPN